MPRPKAGEVHQDEGALRSSPGPPFKSALFSAYFAGLVFWLWHRSAGLAWSWRRALTLALFISHFMPPCSDSSADFLHSEGFPCRIYTLNTMTTNRRRHRGRNETWWRFPRGEQHGGGQAAMGPAPSTKFIDPAFLKSFNSYRTQQRNLSAHKDPAPRIIILI